MTISGLGTGLPAAYRLPAVRPPVAAPAVEVGRLPARPVVRDTAPVPAGSDPALWAVLTAEERTFFARQAALGPVSYAPSRTRQSIPSADVPLGQRIDVRA